MFAAIVNESLSSSSSSFFILLVVSEITIVLDNIFYVNHFRDINKCSDAASRLLLCHVFFLNPNSRSFLLDYARFTTSMGVGGSVTGGLTCAVVVLKPLLIKEIFIVL